MTTTYSRADLVQLIDLVALVAERAGQPDILCRSGFLRHQCPFCTKATPGSLPVIVSIRNRIWSCVACNRRGDVVDFARHAWLCDETKAIEILTERLNETR